jgi:hypothetical protein
MGKDGYASGRTPGFLGIHKSSSLRCPGPLDCTICFIDLEEQKKRARVHFIPDLKVGVFVTLRAPDVIKRFRKRKMNSWRSYW